MGNPDLELQNPERGRPRRRDGGGGGFFTAVAAGILLAIGIWCLCADATTRSLIRLQQQCVGSAALHPTALGLAAAPGGSDRDKAARCAVRNMKKDTSYLSGVEGVSADEFLQRRNKLARVLVDEGVDAFVAEPGFTFEYYANVSQADWEPFELKERPYYANVSQADWEPFELKERPFLMVIQPTEDGDGAIVAKTSFLAPHFEVGRLRMLSIPSSDPDVDIVVFQEHWNPYATLRKSCLFPPVDPKSHDDERDQRPTLMVDPEMRNLVVNGLWDAGFQHQRPTHAVKRLPQIKSDAEIAILRAVNTASVAAIRAVRPCLVPGLTEDDARSMMHEALGAVGMTPHMDSVLFDEHTALPHGGVQTGDKVLTYSSVVSMQIAVHHLGYSSDVGRSFSIQGPASDRNTVDSQDKVVPKNDPHGPEKELVWKTVLAAQAAARKALVSNATAAEVDRAARHVIEHAGYGYAFSHRLGHGIGVRAHEAPYLNEFNKAETLLPGMVFVNGPGVYLEERFGVRLADVYLVTEDGEPELLTGRLSKGLDSPQRRIMTKDWTTF